MIREANYHDGQELQNIQSRCIAGNTLKIVTVNGPDFFARTNAYERCKIFVACDQHRTIGSVACAILETVVNGRLEKAGYIFQAFVAPEFRGKGIVRKLYEHCEQFLKSQGVRIGYGLILQDNLANRRAAGRAGYEAYKGPRIEYLLTYRKMPVHSATKRIRTMTMADAGMVCDLLNRMWMGYDLYEPMTVNKLVSDIERIPGFDLDNIVIVEDNGRIVACASYWDWSEITKITVRSWNARIKITAIALDVARIFRKCAGLDQTGRHFETMVFDKFRFRFNRRFLTFA